MIIIANLQRKEEELAFGNFLLDNLILSVSHSNCQEYSNTPSTRGQWKQTLMAEVLYSLLLYYCKC